MNFINIKATLKNEFPIIYFEDNLIFNTSGDCWALYKVKNFDYMLKKTEYKLSMLHSLSRFISEAGEKIKFLIVPTILNTDKIMSNLSNRLENVNMNPEIKVISKKVIEEQHSYIEDNSEGGVNEYEVYVLVNLKKRKNIIEGLIELVHDLKQPATKINEFFGADAFEISKSQLMQYKALSKDFLKRIVGRIRVKPVDNPEHIERLIRRTFYRGLEDMDKVEVREYWKPSKMDKGEKIEPFLKDISVICKGEFEVPNFKRTVSITHEDGRVSYQAFIPVSHMPDNMLFPGSEYFMIMQYLDFPVECCVNIENIEYGEALKKIERKRRDLNSQIGHVQTNEEDIPYDLREAREAVEELEGDLRSAKSPLMRVSIVLCVYADNKELLEERIAKIRAMYKEIKFFTERPISDQENFFMEFLPGTNNYVRDFEIMMTGKTLAGGMMGATMHIGDEVGPYIGSTSNLGRPVFLSLLHACQIDKSASAFVWGALGYGKSFNTNLLVYLHVLNGARAFIVDPKNERRNWVKTIPELASYISVTTFGSSVEDMGKLDPFLIHDGDINEASNLAVNIIAEIFDLKVSDDRYTVLAEAVQRMKGFRDVHCMETLVKTLEEFPKNDDLHGMAKSLARMIRTLKKPGLSGLLYGDRKRKEGLSFNNIINIVNINGLQLPMSNKSREQYSTEEKWSTVLMLAVANYAKRFSQMDNKMQKIVVMDEAWALAKTDQGKNLFETLARTGRSLNTSTIFIGHSATDIPTEGIRNAITYKFCFNVGNRREAEESLKFLDMELSEDNIRLLASENGLENGECILSDVYGRKGRLVFDAVFDHLESAFRTTPEGVEA